MSNLEEKLLYDFHGNAPIIDDTFKGQLPKITNKASIYIAEQLQPGQYFKFGVDGGGCSGFQYLFDTAIAFRFYANHLYILRNRQKRTMRGTSRLSY